MSDNSVIYTDEEADGAENLQYNSMFSSAAVFRTSAVKPALSSLKITEKDLNKSTSTIPATSARSGFFENKVPSSAAATSTTSGTPSSSKTCVYSSTPAPFGTPNVSATPDISAILDISVASVTPSSSATLAPSTSAATLVSFADKHSSGVKEGSSHKYDSEDVNFAYCYRPIDLYRVDENDDSLYFDDFIKPSYGITPRSGIGFLDHEIIDNLSKQGILSMRPIQIAAFQAIFFRPSESHQGPSDFLGVSVTGSGKTHAFLIPLVQKCLMDMKECPFNAKLTPSVLIFAHTTMLVESIYQKALELVKDTGVIVRMIAGKTEFISDSYFNIGICSIGRFVNHFYPGLKGVKIDLKDLKYVVIDEADKMVLLDEFPPLYYKLKEKADFATLLFSATNNSSVKSFVDPDNHYAFYYGTPNTVATSVRQKFWQVNSRAISQVYGAFREEPIFEPLETDELPHPFDAIYCLLDRDIKKRKLTKRVLIFVKRTAVADFIAQRLTLYGIPTVSVHSGVAITCVDFKNHEDYCPAVLQQIVFNTKEKLPEFMIEFAQNAQKLRELEKDGKHNFIENQ
uniref:ATP-dependent RNA helicase n=1 Tax=Panagrolaimus sp. ES5 TaxID=591445 RepID=A0AC34FIG6_9BILA